MRYWRHYPKFLQTILLMLMIFTMTSFALVLANFCVTKFFGQTIEGIAGITSNSSPKLIAAAQFLQGVSSLFTFLISALLFAYLCHPQPLSYLGLKKIKNVKLLVLTAIITLAVVPLFSQIGAWMQTLDFGKGAKALFESQQAKMQALMQGSSVSDLILYLFLFALLPAFGEEFLFRGIVMRFAYNTSQNIHFAIIFAASIFGLAHGNVYHFLPIMLAGVLLGYLYYLSSSLWLSILGHFLNNALAVVLVFIGNNKIISEQVSKAENLPWYVLISALLIFTVAFFLLRQNATPLAPDWNDDFKGESQTQ